MRWLDGITHSVDMNLGKLWEIDSEGQGGLACCSPRGHKQLDRTERLNSNNSKKYVYINQKNRPSGHVTEKDTKLPISTRRDSTAEFMVKRCHYAPTRMAESSANIRSG